MESVTKQKSWGGPWTEKKLNAFSKYVWSYLTIMKKFPYWKTIYFDGFAGSGSRSNNDSDILAQLQITQEEERVYQGAAERIVSLDSDHAFDYYYFVDTNEDSLQKLENHLKTIDASEGKQLVFRSGNANEQLLKLSKSLKSKDPMYAALVFLDPFGMHIDWDSIASLKGTRSDVWILVPTGVIVNRLLDKRGELKFSKKLTSFFGLSEEEIRNHFYSKEVTPTLFGEEEIVTKVMKPVEKISQLYIQRLKTVWEHVTEIPLRLDNTRGVPIFHFVFASNNNTGVKIANQIISKM